MAYNQGVADWKHGFCDCCGNCGECCYGYWCGCIAEAVASSDQGDSALLSVLHCLLYPWLLPVLRNQVRESKNIQGSLVGDLVLGLCCPCCTLIQTRREIYE